MKLLTKLGSIFDRILDFCCWLAGGLLIFAWLLTTVDVVMRYFLNRPIVGTFEMVEHILMLVTFLSAAWLLKEDGHVKVDIVLTMFSTRIQTLVNTITSIIGAIACIVVARYGAQVFWSVFQSGEAFPTRLGFPKAPIYFLIPAGCLMLFIQFLRRAYGYLRGK